jgi:hypothetical protein
MAVGVSAGRDRGATAFIESTASRAATIQFTMAGAIDPSVA